MTRSSLFSLPLPKNRKALIDPASCYSTDGYSVDDMVTASNQSPWLSHHNGKRDTPSRDVSAELVLHEVRLLHFRF